MYPPRKVSGQGRGTLYVGLAMLLAGSLARMVSHDDVPFGLVEGAAFVAVVLMQLLKERRTAVWAVILGFAGVVVSGGIVEMVKGRVWRGVAILALAPVPIVVRWLGERRRA